MKQNKVLKEKRYDMVIPKPNAFGNFDVYVVKKGYFILDRVENNAFERIRLIPEQRAERKDE